jgi:beta-mannosidase
MYPEEAPYPGLIEREARYQARRLSGRPSVVLWCGGNECVWAHDAWGVAEGRAWKERLQGRTWGAMYYYGLLGMIVDQEAPGTAYWANSPWPGRGGVPINSAAHGDRHTWDARGAKYRTLVPRFCSEFGHQSPASVETLRRALGEAGLVRGSAVLEHRQRGTGGTAAHIDAALEEIYGPRVREAGFEEWHRLAQEAQARSLRIGIEWLRVNRPRCMGALVWQLNDAWAGMSWSLIDSGGVEKPAYRAVAEAFRPRIVTVQPWRGEAWLWAVNDEREAWETRVDVRRASGDGRTVAEARGVAVRCGGDGAAPVVGLAALVGGLGEGERYVVAWEGGEAVWEKGVDG